jgi:CBS domain-containing protein
MVKTVADYMTRDPICVHVNTPLQEAIQLLASHSVSGLPVVDDRAHPLGVLAESDLMCQASGIPLPPHIVLLDSIIYLQNPITYDRNLHKALGQTVGEVMTHHPIAVHPSDSLSKAAQMMHDRHIHRLLVVDAEAKLVGIITQSDVVRAMAVETPSAA